MERGKDRSPIGAEPDTPATPARGGKSFVILAGFGENGQRRQVSARIPHPDRTAPVVQHSSQPTSASNVNRRRQSSQSALARAAAPVIESLETRRLFVVDFNIVNFVDEGGANAQYEDDIRRVVEAAGDDWGEQFDSNVSIQIEIRFTLDTVTDFRLRGETFFNETIRRNGNVEVKELGPAHEIRTGDDPNGGVPDVILEFNTSNIEEFFWDPAPGTRTAPIPAGDYDAFTFVLHELGHVLGFTAFKNPFTGAVQNNQVTVYDELVAFPDPFNAVFTGTFARQEFGNFVPLTFGSINHYGNRFGEGSDLAQGLMGPDNIAAGERRFIGEIDLAILKDLGLPVFFTGNPPPNPPVPPLLDIGGTPRHDVIEVIYTGSFFLLNVTNKTQTGSRFNPFTGESEPVFEQVTTRYSFPSAGFTQLVIRGQQGSDRITVNAGMIPCTIVGGDGNDTIIGGDANDTLEGNAGNDQLAGGNGDDRLDGGGGQDLLIGGFGNDRLFGLTGDDTLDGSIGEDRLFGGDGNDSVYGGRGNDRLFGEIGDDFLSGDDGKDTMDGGVGADRMEGGVGLDTADYSMRTAPLVVTLDETEGDGEADENDNVTFNTEVVWGGLGGDRMVGTGANNVLWGNFGNDTIDGGTGHDHLEGAEGNDVLDGQNGRDTIFGGADNDRINGGDDPDLIFGGAGNDRIFTVDLSADTVNGGAGDDLFDPDDRDLIDDAGI